MTIEIREIMREDKSQVREEAGNMGMSTVAVIEAGIGALSLGFKEAGYQVVAAFEEDKKAVEASR